MGFRFRKSVKIAPGVKVNFGKKGVGMSFGTKGARYSINSSGRRTTTIGIPGTGLSYSTSKSGKSKGKSSSKANDVNYASLPTSSKSKTVTLLLCIFFGYLGVHRFYAGKIGTGTAWLLTAGMFFVGWIYDIVIIASNQFLDKNGNVIRK